MAKKIGLKVTSSGAAGVGTVTELREASDYDGGPGVFCVTLRHGERKKPPKREANKPYPYEPDPPTTNVKVPAGMAKKLRVGQKVRIILEPVDDE